MPRAPHLVPLFFFNDTAPTEIYTLSLHDALPIFARGAIGAPTPPEQGMMAAPPMNLPSITGVIAEFRAALPTCPALEVRSEEHTSELQSHLNLVCRLLLEKKKNKPE